MGIKLEEEDAKITIARAQIDECYTASKNLQEEGQEVINDDTNKSDRLCSNNPPPIDLVDDSDDEDWEIVD